MFPRLPITMLAGLLAALIVATPVKTMPPEPTLIGAEQAVTLSAGAETRLRRPVVLAPPHELRVVLDPAHDPWDGRWGVQLLSGAGQSRRIVAKNTPAADDGHWLHGGLAPGSYRVVVSSSRGARWAQRDVDVPGDGTVFVDVRGQPIEGRVRLGRRPLSALVVFGGRSGASRIPLRADAEGSFSGFLPPREEGDERPRVVYVECDEPPIRRTLMVTLERDPASDVLRADIVLPHTRLRGTVLAPDRRPVRATALVSLWAREVDPAEALVQTVVTPEDEGRFVLEGARPGSYLVHASNGTQTSDEQLVSLPEEGEAASIELVLREDRKVTGRVVSPEGRPVAGASVFVLAAERPFTPLPALRTAADGLFVVKKLPGDTRALKLRVVAEGYAYAFRMLPIPDDGHVAVALERTAGRLVLGLADEQAASAILVHDGHYVFPNWLDAWSGAHGAGRDERGRRVVPQMPPGHYRLCLPRDAAELRALVQGALAAGRCASGVLAAGGELSLALPAG
jgi:hypothetical protein